MPSRSRRTIHSLPVSFDCLSRRVPSESDAGREVQPMVVRETGWHAGIAIEQLAGRRGGINCAVHIVLEIGPVENAAAMEYVGGPQGRLPSHSSGYGEPVGDFVSILGIKAGNGFPVGHFLGAALAEGRLIAEQEVGEPVLRNAPIKCKGAVLVEAGQSI